MGSHGVESWGHGVLTEMAAGLSPGKSRVCCCCCCLCVVCVVYVCVCVCVWVCVSTHPLWPRRWCRWRPWTWWWAWWRRRRASRWRKPDPFPPGSWSTSAVETASPRRCSAGTAPSDPNITSVILMGNLFPLLFLLVLIIFVDVVLRVITVFSVSPS